MIEREAEAVNEAINVKRLLVDQMRDFDENPEKILEELQAPKLAEVHAVDVFTGSLATLQRDGVIDSFGCEAHVNAIYNNGTTKEVKGEEEEVFTLKAIDVELPKNLSAAYKSKYKQQWEAAMAAELQSQEENKVFEIVPRSSVPEGDTIVGSRWVFGVKADVDGFVTRFKARLVAQGFSQIEGKDFDDMFAPVVALRDVVLLIALSTVKKLKMSTIDISTAFLNAPLISHSLLDG